VCVYLHTLLYIKISLNIVSSVFCFKITIQIVMYKVVQI